MDRVEKSLLALDAVKLLNTMADELETLGTTLTPEDFAAMAGFLRSAAFLMFDQAAYAVMAAMQDVKAFAAVKTPTGTVN